MYKREDLSKQLLLHCQACHFGGQNVFPDCLSFDPTQNCIYFDDISDEDPRDPNYDCPGYIHQKTYDDFNKNFFNTSKTQ